MIRSSSARSSGTLADDVRLPLLRVDVAVGARDVEVAAEDEAAGRRARRRRPAVQRLEEAHLGGEVLAAVGHVDRRDRDVAADRRSTMRFSKSKSG